MKIQNNNTIFFKAGMTKQLKAEISSCNPTQISKEFSKYNIPTDFKNNKIIAWCTYKCLECIKSLNTQYNLNLGMPNGIFVEDFAKLNISNTDADGFCNIAPTHLYKNSDNITPGKILFFNEHPSFNHKKGNAYWDKIDEISDMAYKVNSATTFFLDIFLHEFSHVIHEDHLLNKLGGFGLINFCQKYTIDKNIEAFKNKYQQLFYSNSCLYAGSHPMEAIACDLSKRICDSLNKDTLTPETNFIEKSPYRKFSFTEKILEPLTQSNYNKAIKRCWDGNLK